MEPPVLTFYALADAGDQRGRSFSPPPELLSDELRMSDLHIATVRPGRIRGNHFHVKRNEVLIVTYADRWSLYWDDGETTPVNHQEFHGPGATIIRVPPLASHAIHNDGTQELNLVGISDQVFDANSPDSFPRRVTPE